MSKRASCTHPGLHLLHEQRECTPCPGSWGDMGAPGWGDRFPHSPPTKITGQALLDPIAHIEVPGSSAPVPSAASRVGGSAAREPGLTTSPGPARGQDSCFQCKALHSPWGTGHARFSQLDVTRAESTPKPPGEVWACCVPDPSTGHAHISRVARAPKRLSAAPGARLLYTLPTAASLSQPESHGIACQGVGHPPLHSPNSL